MERIIPFHKGTELNTTLAERDRTIEGADSDSWGWLVVFEYLHVSYVGNGYF